jgi:ABC-2 type transport system permease protein
MAGLGSAETVSSGTGGAAPSSGAQFRAIAWLRWRLFVSAFGRKSGKAEFVARIVMIPFVAVFTVGPIVAAGAAGYYAVSEHAAWALLLLLWAVFGAWVFVTSATTLAPPTVDLALLLRFPIRFPSYVVIRLFFGLLATPNVVGTLSLAAAAIGIGIARPGIFPWAALVLGVYAAMIVLLLRMVLLWLERWLAQRRTREILGVAFTLVFVAVQYVNFQMTNFGHARRARHGGPTGMQLLAAKFSFLLGAYKAVRPLAELLPPALAARSIASFDDGAWLPAAAALAAVFAFAALFAALFALRLRGEFRGENFNESPARSTAPVGGKGRDGTEHPKGFELWGVPPAIVACMEKELRYLVRGPSLLMGVLTPLVLVGLYANRMGSFELLLPGAMAYTMFAMVPMLYNVLGQDAAGSQLYLLSPTPIRTVFLAKNLVLSALICLVGLIAALLVVWRQPPTAPILAGTAMWFAFVLFTNLSFGNFRSIMAPRKVDMGKFQRRQGTSQVSALIVLAVLVGSLAAGLVLLWVCRYVGHVWAAPVILSGMALLAFLYYLRSLNGIGRLALDQRDGLIEALGKGAA